MQAKELLQAFKQITCKRGPCGRTIIDQRYALEPGVIGVGSFSKVRKAKVLTEDLDVAVKICSVGYLKKQTEAYRDQEGNLKYRTGLDKVLSEISILQELKTHHGVCNLIEVLWDNFEDRLYLILELANEGEIIIWNNGLRAFFLRNDPANVLADDDLSGIKTASNQDSEDEDDAKTIPQKSIFPVEISKANPLSQRQYLSESSVRFVTKHLLKILIDRSHRYLTKCTLTG